MDSFGPRLWRSPDYSPIFAEKEQRRRAGIFCRARTRVLESLAAEYRSGAASKSGQSKPLANLLEIPRQDLRLTLCKHDDVWRDFSKNASCSFRPSERSNEASCGSALIVAEYPLAPLRFMVVKGPESVRVVGIAVKPADPLLDSTKIPGRGSDETSDTSTHGRCPV
jgi:hypothetical protein